MYATRRLVLFYISTKYHKNIPKVFDLQSGHEINGLSLSNITKGDNAKSKKGRVVILVCDTSSCPVLYFCQVPSKYSKGYSSYKADTTSFSNKTKCDNPKGKKARLSILYATRHLVLFYISIKYHQNIPKGIQVSERTRSFTSTLTLTPTPTGSVPKTIYTPPPTTLVWKDINKKNDNNTTCGKISI